MTQTKTDRYNKILYQTKRKIAWNMELTEKYYLTQTLRLYLDNQRVSDKDRRRYIL